MAAEEVIELLVVDDQQAVHILHKLVDAVYGPGESHVTFILERYGDHSHGEDALVLCHLGDLGSCAGSGTSSHSSRDEEHLCTFSQHYLFDLVLGFKGCIAALGGIGSGTEGVTPYVYLDRDRAFLESLPVSVADYEAASLYILAEHVIDRVAASATDSDDLDH